MKSMRDDQEKHAIRLPGTLLDQIRNKEEKGDYNDDGKYESLGGTKRKTKPRVSRKDRRKEERELKKQKVSSKNTSSKSKSTVSSQNENKRSKEKVRDNRNASKGPDSEDLEDDVFDGFGEGDFSGEDFSGDDFGDSDNERGEDGMSAEDTMAALMALKKNKKTKNTEKVDASSKTPKVDKSESAEDVMAALKAMKEKKGKAPTETKLKISKNVSSKEAKKKSNTKKEKFAAKPLTPQELELKRRDESDMNFYAKKLGLKKSSKLTKAGDDDLIGGLLDGLDFNFDSSLDNESELDEDRKLPFSSDDEIDTSDFSDSGEGTYENGEFDQSDSERSSSGKTVQIEKEEEESKPQRENPFVAPGTETDSKRYIPPALRKRLESQAMSEETIKLNRSIKGPLNRLSEANITTIVNDINGLFSENPRQLVNEALTKIILESIVQQGRLLDTFVILHAAIVASIYRIQGVEFGAYFIQTLVEQLEQFQVTDKETKGKKASNLISLLVATYSFQIISCKLLYDLIRTLISEITEENTELLLRLIRNAGNQMRLEDPGALKEIILELQTTVSKTGDTNTRTKFLIETIISLKNNKMKTTNEQSHQLVIRMKKFLGNLNNNKFNDPIHVSLEDIHNIKSKGKWWLVGSAWKGNDIDPLKTKSVEVDVNKDFMNDILDSAEPNWMDLARTQRMNTDIRRAIFISIMSANDYIDASDKLDKLGLKRAQEREIPRVLLHCTGVEPAWNPYYGILASKLCDNHSLRKTFQFVLWDLIKDLEGEELNETELDFDTHLDDETVKLRRILNVGRFFGYLIAQGSLAMNVLRTINFLTASSDTVIFMEVLLITFFDIVGKKSQINIPGVKANKSLETNFDDKVLIERLLKTQEQTSLLRGLQFFLQDKVKVSDAVTGKKQRGRVDWGVDATCDIIDEFLKNTE